MKKRLFIGAFISIFLGLEAQNPAQRIPNTPLTESSIEQTLELSRKQGVQEWELQKLSAALHTRMLEQQRKGLNNPLNQRNNLPPPQVNASACVNPGFENGTTSSWSLYSGNINGVNLPCNTCAATLGSINKVVNAASTVTGQCSSGVDSYGNFPVVAPSGGNYSLLLNDVSAGGKIMRASYSFVVASASDFFTFQYAAVLQSGGHAPNQQPYFHVDVTDNTLNATVPCTEYDATAPASGAAQGWFVSNLDNTVSYKPWTTVAIDLHGIIGHTVTVNFIVSDCDQGGHFGYCYIDANCGSSFSASNVSGICGTSGN